MLACGFSFHSKELLYSGSNQNSSPMTGNGISVLVEDPFNSEQVLFARDSSVWVLELSSGRSTLLAGKVGEHSYQPGRGSNATFNGIGGILGYDSAFIIVTDRLNYCIRSINRASQVVSRFAGKCETQRNKYGSLRASRFGELRSIVANPKSQDLYVFDSTYKILKFLKMNSAGGGSTVEIATETDNLDGFGGMAFSLNGEKLYAVSNSRIWWYDPASNDHDFTMSNISFCTTKSCAGTQDLIGVTFLTKDFILTADPKNLQLYTVKLLDNTVSSTCLDNMATCAGAIPSPGFITRHPTKDRILVSSGTNIYELSFTSKCLLVPL